MVIKTTCKECSKEQRRFCRHHSVAKNSHICRLVQKGRFKDAKSALVLPSYFSGRKTEI